MGGAERQHSIAQITDVRALNLQCVEVLGDIGEERLHTRQPDVASVELCQAVLELDVGIKQPKQGRYVHAVERLHGVA